MCDSPEYFYDFIGGILSDMDAPLGHGNVDRGDRAPAGCLGPVEGLLTCHQAKGVGYAMSTEDELKVTAEVAATTGVVLDPVYSGKALHGLLRDMAGVPYQFTRYFCSSSFLQRPGTII